MPWLFAMLRGQKIYAKAKADGTLDAVGGRVEIRYKPNDGRVYQAGSRNLEIVPGGELMPDETCGEAAPAPTKPQDPPQAGRPRGATRTERSAERKEKAAASALAPGAVPKDAYTVYADGACSGNPGPAGLGIVIVAPDGKMAEGFEYLGTATNNIAELTAILRAAELVPNEAAAVVHTDSQYSIGVLTKGWKAKANQELVANVKAALAKRKGWRIVYVPGHAGVPLNERADALAREAVGTRASKLPARAASD